MLNRIKVPKLSLVVLIGASGSGKSTFARKHFLTTEVLSSDACRGMISDNETDQAVTVEAFDVLHYIAAKRLGLGRLTVVDATNVQPEARKPLVELARRYHSIPVAIVLNLPEKVCHERNKTRADRRFGPHVLRQRTSEASGTRMAFHFQSHSLGGCALAVPMSARHGRSPMLDKHHCSSVYSERSWGTTCISCFLHHRSRFPPCATGYWAARLLWESCLALH